MRDKARLSYLREAYLAKRTWGEQAPLLSGDVLQREGAPSPHAQNGEAQMRSEGLVSILTVAVVVAMGTGLGAGAARAQGVDIGKHEFETC